MSEIKVTQTHPLRAALDAALAHEQATTLAWQDDDDAPSDPNDPGYATAPTYIAMKAAEVALEQARQAFRDSDCPREWRLIEEGHCYCEDFVASSPEEALEEARSNVERSNYSDASGTIWIDVRVVCPDTEEEDTATVALDEEEPACPDHASHDFQSPTFLGGLAENPGVHGHGGGVIITECCMHCGCKRVTDTWAQNPDTGEQGLRSVSYEEGAFADELAALEEAS